MKIFQDTRNDTVRRTELGSFRQDGMSAGQTLETASKTTNNSHSHRRRRLVGVRTKKMTLTAVLVVLDCSEIGSLKGQKYKKALKSIK